MLDQQAHNQPHVVLRYSATAVALPEGVAHIGRGPSCFICVDDPRVSRQHLRITVGSSSVVVEDLDSKNGTLVNGERLHGSRELQDGDTITLGERVFVVGFGESVPNEEETPTPFPPRSPTLQGVGKIALGERCPRCQEAVAVGSSRCATCGFEWRRGSHHSPTSQHDQCRRRDPRVPVVIPARFASARWEGQGEILNLSSSGAFFSAPQAEAVGTRCELEVRGDDGKRLTLRGFVRHAIHRGDRGMGIEFAALEPEGEQWIRARLARLPA